MGGRWELKAETNGVSSLFYNPASIDRTTDNYTGCLTSNNRLNSLNSRWNGLGSLLKYLKFIIKKRIWPWLLRTYFNLKEIPLWAGHQQVSILCAWGEPCGGACTPQLPAVSRHCGEVVKCFDSGQCGPGSIPGRSRSSSRRLQCSKVVMNLKPNIKLVHPVYQSNFLVTKEFWKYQTFTGP